VISDEQISPAKKAKRSTEQPPRDWLPRDRKDRSCETMGGVSTSG
jgi:hypothetical protein